MLQTMLPVVAAVVAALLAHAAFKPDTLRLSRSANIAAPSGKMFALINDLRRFSGWNPFAKLGPQHAIMGQAVGEAFKAGLANLKARAEKP